MWVNLTVCTDRDTQASCSCPRLGRLCQMVLSRHPLGAVAFPHVSSLTTGPGLCKQRTGNGAWSLEKHRRWSVAAFTWYWQQYKFRCARWWRVRKKLRCSADMSMQPLFCSLWHSWPESLPFSYFAFDISSLGKFGGHSVRTLWYRHTFTFLWPPPRLSDYSLCKHVDWRTSCAFGEERKKRFKCLMQ